MVLPVVAVSALLVANRLSRPAIESPGVEEHPAAALPVADTAPTPSPALAPDDILEALAIGFDQQLLFDQQARLEQAAAAEQAQGFRDQQIQLQRDSEIRALNAQFRAREAADRQVRRYHEDIGGHLHSILGE